MYYATRGRIPHKRHTQFRQPDGSLYHEELMGIHGFSGNKSLLYHLRPPTAVQRVEPGCEVKTSEAPQGPVRHRLLRTAGIRAGGDAVEGRVPVMANSDVRISLVRPQQAMSYWYRYAHGDEVIFVHEGDGVLESQFGSLRYGPGDYLVVPTGVIWRILPGTDSPQRMLVVETAGGHIEPPRRYINNHGQFLESAPYSERDIRPPDRLEPHDEPGEFEVRVKARGRISRYFYNHHPLDVVGWDGYLWPFAFNIEDFEPITGRVHQPPPVHQTFDGPGFVLCSFVPRLFDYHPEAIPAPYNHSNVDSDEVIYYVAGDFMSRRGIEAASITVHPNGIPHGPAPGTYEGSIGKTETRELAVMVDTFRPLLLTQEALALEDEGYAFSWLS
jgi:homogentisate 1,2-dioxygenase